MEHQAVPQSSFGVKVTLQILQMEPLYSPGVGYQHHPVVFHLRKMLGSLLEKLNAVEPSWGLVGRTGLVLMPGVPLFQTSQSTGSPAVGTGKFLLTCPVLLISVLTDRSIGSSCHGTVCSGVLFSVAHPSEEGMQQEYKDWPALKCMV